MVYNSKLVFPQYFYQLNDHEELIISQGILGEAIYCSLNFESLLNEMNSNMGILELKFDELPEGLKVASFRGLSRELTNFIHSNMNNKVTDYDIIFAPRIYLDDNFNSTQCTPDEFYDHLVSTNIKIGQTELILDKKLYSNVRINDFFVRTDIEE